jgi:hypothetical protein
MNKRLEEMMAAAKAQLDEAGQEELCQMVSDFIAARRDGAAFTPEELAHLREIDREPFEAADAQEVKQAFRRVRA